jgi:hypothetical protein
LDEEGIVKDAGLQDFAKESIMPGSSNQHVGPFNTRTHHQSRSAARSNALHSYLYATGLLIFGGGTKIPI